MTSVETFFCRRFQEGSLHSPAPLPKIPAADVFKRHQLGYVHSEGDHPFFSPSMLLTNENTIPGASANSTKTAWSPNG